MRNTRLLLLISVAIGLIFEEVNLSPDLYWRDYTHGDIPYDAFEAYPGMYIGQTYFSNALVPTNIYSDTSIPPPSYYAKYKAKILCTPNSVNYYWQTVDFTTNNITLMRNAVVGGFEDNRLLYIGRLHHLGRWKIGKVFDIEDKKMKGIYVWGDNRQVVLQQFQLLKYYTHDDCNCILS